MTTTTTRAQKAPGRVRLAGHQGHVPCGRKCILRGDRKHFFCSCGKEDCTLCNDPARFGRAPAGQTEPRR